MHCWLSHPGFHSKPRSSSRLFRVFFEWLLMILVVVVRCARTGGVGRAVVYSQGILYGTRHGRQNEGGFK